jgi:single-stranded-DNA-specific exonuclease
VAKRAPGLIRRFGGHAQAAGLTIGVDDYEPFAAAFERALDEMLPAEARTRSIETDGSLEAPNFTLEVARMLDGQIWGQGFPQPLFCDTFNVEHQRAVGEKHLKLGLAKDGRRYDAICFNALEEGRGAAQGALRGRIRAAYRLSINEYNGLRKVQINVEHFE